jgi:hypothetical protein
MKPFFSFYGSKWRGSLYYPEPEYDTIIEPFAGSACYATRFYERNIILCEKDPIIAGIWEWLIKAQPYDIEILPDIFFFEEMALLPIAVQNLIGFWLNKGSVAPARGPSAWMRSNKWPTQFWGPAIKERLISQVSKIKHWRVQNISYEAVDFSGVATWFVDSPYQTQGKHYKYNEIDYENLAKWCYSRRGQLIACEQEGADWLPFKPFRTMKSLKSRHSKEVVYLQSTSLHEEKDRMKIY